MRKTVARSVLAAVLWAALLVHCPVTVCAFYLAVWLDLVLHEAGHALVARLFGHAVLDIYLGAGRPAHTFNFGLCDVHIAPWPLVGMVGWVPRRHRVPPTQAFLVTAAGPLASATLVGLTVLYTTVIASGDAPLWAPVRTFVWAVMLTSLGSGLGNLLPMERSTWDKDCPSDGSRLVQIIRHGVPDHVSALCVVGLKRGLRLCDAGEHRRGVRLILRSMRDVTLRQNSLLTAKLATILSHHDLVDEARGIYREILGNPVLPRGCAARRYAADGFASLVLYNDRQDLLEEAKATITSAVEESPDAITLRVTLGGVLCELGDVEAAEAMLADALARSTQPLDQAIASAYLAVISSQRGKSGAATRHLKKAQASAGEHRLVRRLVAEVSSHAERCPRQRSQVDDGPRARMLLAAAGRG